MTQIQHYEVGDHVHVSVGSLSGPATTGAFEVVGFYRVECRARMYRLLGLQNREERVVPHAELRRMARRGGRQLRLKQERRNR